MNGCQELRRGWEWERRRGSLNRAPLEIFEAMEVFWALAEPMSMSWLYGEAVTTGTNWVKGPGGLSVVFLTTACESTIFPKWKV